MNREVLARETEQLLESDEIGAQVNSWSHDMERHAKKCVERYCDLANKKAEQLYKVSAPILDDHQFKKRRRRNGRIFVESPELLVVGTHLWTSSDKVDKSMWQTLGSFGFVHSQHE